MRDPARIPQVLGLLHKVWAEHPDMRLGQLLVNITGSSDPFHVEDDVLVDDLKEWLETSKTWKSR